MDKVQRLIKNSHNLYYGEIHDNFKYIPKYIIRAYIRKNPHKYFEIGFIYQYYYENYKKMYEYYIKAMDNANTLVHLGCYYAAIEKYEIAKDYYMQAIELGHMEAMTYVALYYAEIEDYSLMKKYYLDAIALGNINALHCLGNYYHYTEHNYDLMKQYYIGAIKLNNNVSIKYMKYYYKN